MKGLRKAGETLLDDADYIIVGTGAGGATAARVLSAAGLSVILLEEGPHLTPEQRALPLGEAMSQSVRDMATVATTSSAPFPLLTGRCVGGSTAINSGIIWRLPQDVIHDWSERFGLAELVDGTALTRIFEQLESELEVDEVSDAVRGGNAALMERGARALGLPGKPMQRNASRCQGAARCLQGCPNGARQSMDVSYIPRALADGARLHPLSRAERVIFKNGRASAVEGQLLNADRSRRGRFRVGARRGVIVAAGALHTPVLLWNSGLRRMVGERYQAHPGVAIVGEFDEQVNMGYGSTQAYEVPLRERGLKLESLSLPPELLAARLPGAGASWQERLTRLDHFAQWCAINRMGALGTVRPGLLGGVKVRYEPLPADLERVKGAAVLLCRMLFAAGAKAVFPGIGRVPEVLTSADQADAILVPSVERRDFHLMASHHFGTACASSDPRTGVVGADLQSHDVKGLYVMDASVFPTNLGVNPQHSIMAVVFRAAERLANKSSQGLAA